MVDRAFFFEELLSAPNLRGKVYEVSASRDASLGCVELVARRGADWFFARRWVGVSFNRRALYRLIDQAEEAGFRFAVASQVRGASAPLRELVRQTARASEFLAELTEEERGIFRELFPEETRLLASGYDWDQERVWFNERPLPADPQGRLLERSEGRLWEWVRVEEEFTWRRYPLETLRVEATKPIAAPDASGAVGAPA